MRNTAPFLFLVALVASCAGPSPLEVAEWRTHAALPPRQERPHGGVRVTYLGNTTLHFTDGETSLMVDGFLSRPGLIPMKWGKIEPNRARISRALADAGIEKLDAVLVGHTHYDHALDSPVVAMKTGAVAMGSASYAQVHRGTLRGETDPPGLIIVPCSGGKRTFGRFTVTFVESDHVTAHLPEQEKITGSIKSPVVPPAKMTDYKCGPVFAIHIAHPDGDALVTTTAGAADGKLDGFRAGTVFLGIGLLGRETPRDRDRYWREVVDAVDPHTVIPVHWDNFTKKMSKGRPLVAMPKKVDDTAASIAFVKEKAAQQSRKIVALDAFERITLSQRSRVGR